MDALTSVTVPTTQSISAALKYPLVLVMSKGIRFRVILKMQGGGNSEQTMTREASC